MDIKAVRKVVRKLNHYQRNGFAGNGFLVFDENGDGGAWYSAGSQVRLPNHRAFNIGWRRHTAKEIFALIEYLNDYCRD